LSARGAIFHTKHVLNANVVRVVLLDSNSYLALKEHDTKECVIFVSPDFFFKGLV
jgi:hypothetical protein